MGSLIQKFLTQKDPEFAHPAAIYGKYDYRINLEVSGTIWFRYDRIISGRTFLTSYG